ncbi:uncharacterized protein A4U43_C01F34430 [Asparagus officinalis]|uniref:VQ domain-containing protein n=1 Tax=Asparagus officinalis TaxID=4686 RepID=A0A5P1FUB8_ASPOF|nr:uncharacterized protein A4U43_C01F34430 [Asparagus officinalis]
MLTGSAETTAKTQSSSFVPAPPKNLIPPVSKSNKKPAFKLYERRSSMKNLKMINPLVPSAAAFSARRQVEILSPSVLDFPKLMLSLVTPLSLDPFNRSPVSLNLGISVSPEDRAIAEKGYYLHPSPRQATLRDAEPTKLLPLFPRDAEPSKFILTI